MQGPERPGKGRGRQGRCAWSAGAAGRGLGSGAQQVVADECLPPVLVGVVDAVGGIGIGGRAVLHGDAEAAVAAVGKDLLREHQSAQELPDSRDLAKGRRLLLTSGCCIRFSPGITVDQQQLPATVLRRAPSAGISVEKK